MEEIKDINKFQTKNILDAIIISVCAVVSCLSFMFGIVVIGYVLIAIAAGFFAKTIVIKSYLTSAISAVIGLGASILLTTFVYKVSFTPFILTFSFLLCGGAFAITIMLGAKKTTSVVIMTIILVLVVLLAIVYSYYMTGGVLTFDGIKEYINSFFTGIKTEFENALSNYASYMITAQDIQDLATTFYNMIRMISIGVVIMVMEFVALLTTTFLKLGIKQSHAEVVLPSYWRVEPNKFASGLFLISVGGMIVSRLIFIFGANAFETVYYVIMNMVLVLIPMFACYGSVKLIENTFKKKRINIFTIFAIILLIFQPAIVVIFLGTIGATSIWLKSIREKKIQEDEEQLNYSHNDDSSNWDRYSDNDSNDRYYRDESSEYDSQYYENEREESEYNDDEYLDDEDEYDNKFYGYRENNDKKDE